MQPFSPIPLTSSLILPSLFIHHNYLLPSAQSDRMCELLAWHATEYEQCIIFTETKFEWNHSKKSGILWNTLGHVIQHETTPAG